jgi:hypothetical protein
VSDGGTGVEGRPALALHQQGVGDQEENTRMLAGPDPEAILGASCHKALLQSLGWSRACGVVQVAIGYFRHAPRR